MSADPLANYDTRHYGGDMRMIATLPEDGIHPQTGERVYGTRAELGRVARQPRLSFFRGDIHLKSDPEAQFAMEPWHDNGTAESKDDLFMALQKGWQFGKAEEWTVSEELTLLGWETDLETGHLILPIVAKNMGIYPEKYHFMFCPWPIYLAQQEAMRADADGVINDYQNTDADTMTLIDEDPMNPQRIKPSVRSIKRARMNLDEIPVEE